MHLRVSIALALLAATPTLAATITVRPPTPDRPIVVILEGPLVEADEDQFATKTTALPSAFIALGSEGGSLAAGLRIGEAIRRKGFSTIVPDGRRCASACAFAWLGGIERFLGTDARIGFHAASHPAFPGGRGVIPYLTKMGLPYEAIIYITQVAPNEMTWLNMSDVAERSIRITLLSSLAKETSVAIPTRYGDITVTRDDPECCIGHIRYGDQRIEIASTGQIYASLEGIYKVREGDLVIISSSSGAIGSLLRHYYVLLVGEDGMTDLTSPDFQTSDDTFKVTHRDDEIHFELGFQNRKKKSATYKNGSIAMDIRPPGPSATLPKKECAAVLNMVVTCVRLPECSEGRIFENSPWPA